MRTYYNMALNYDYVRHLELDVGLPKPRKVIGSRRRYHDSTTPHLDFR